VIATDRDEVALAATAAALSDGGATVVTHVMDVSLEADWERA
jgi:hypothetical protein